MSAPLCRESIPGRFTQSQRKAIAVLIPSLANRLQLDSKNQRTLPFSMTELVEIARRADDAIETRFEMPAGMRRGSLYHVSDIAQQAVERFKMREVAVGLILRFRITLADIQPPIWRRIEVPNGTLDDLHEHIQTAMGWTNSHLHHFYIRGRRYGDPLLLHDDFGENDFIDSTTTGLSSIFENNRSPFRFGYEYDFGDCWMHEVVFEGWSTSESANPLPRCTAGARSCPPEDVGGFPGYANFLEVIADLEHEDHDHFVSWSGGKFDPEQFRPAEATKRMRKGLFDWRADLLR